MRTTSMTAPSHASTPRSDLTGNAGGPWAIHVDCFPDVERRDNVTD
jgi:hypothetical protein